MLFKIKSSSNLQRCEHIFHSGQKKHASKIPVSWGSKSAQKRSKTTLNAVLKP